VKNIVKLHGLPSSIVSDRDSKFTSKWWTELHRIMGAKLLMSTAFHPQTDGATERMNRSVAQIFRTMISPDQTDWVAKIPMVEFAINSSINESSGFGPFELNYTRMPTLMPKIKMDESAHKGIRDFVDQATQNLNDAYDAIIAHRVFQKFQADKKRRPEPKIPEGSKVFLSTRDLALPKGRAGKFLPKYIGPYAILEAFPKTSTYTLDLPIALKERGIHPKFHVSKLRPYHQNDDKLFRGREAVDPYDFGEPDDEQEIAEIDDHQWKGATLKLQVRWTDGDTTWENLTVVENCVALDNYLALQGVSEPMQLPKPDRRRRKNAL
jgi:hypothetical protein